MGETNVWKRSYAASFDMSDDKINSFHSRFSELPVNTFLDIYVKRTALKAGASVVCIEIYSGGEKICWGSGFIIECHTNANSQFESTIITSASILRKDPTLNTLVDDLKVNIVLSNGEEHDGEIEACDFHYNLAAIKIQIDHSLETSTLRHVDDVISVDPGKISTRVLNPHSDLYRLVPRNIVIALGRFHDDESGIMVAPGEFSIEQCRFDCKELLRSTCRITKCGIGGPLINCNGEVIGVNFFALDFTPFLPINIVSKWWEHFKEFRDYCRPWLGMELSNLSTVKLRTWEKIIQKFPDIKNGIKVDEVTPDSPAGSAGVHRKDIIVECDDKVVKSALQFFDLTWDRVGKTVNLVVMRSDGSRRNLSMMVADTNPNQFNCWPLPE